MGEYMSERGGVRGKRSKFLILVFTAFLLILYDNQVVSGQESLKVLVLPFEVHSKEDISAFRRQLLETLAGTLDEAKEIEVIAGERLKEMVLQKGITLFDEDAALLLGKELKADMVVLGSITKLGRRYSIDTKVLNLSLGSLSALSYIEGDDPQEVLRGTVDLAHTLHKEVLAEALQVGKVFVSEVGAIGKVTISGNRRVDREAITARIKTKTGDPYTPEGIREDIKAIYDMGYFDDVVVDMRDTAAGKEVTFIVRERPIIRQVNITGNKEVALEKIQEAVTVKANTTLSRTLLRDDVERIKALYAREGFYLARVEPRVEVKEGIEATVDFQIEEGEKVKVKRITVIGNKAFKGKKIKKVMDTKEAGLFSFITKSGSYEEDIFQNDLSAILGLYYDTGYIQAKIEESRVSISEDKRWIYITIAVVEGEQYTVGNIDIQGDILTTKKELVEKVKTTPGKVFNRRVLGQDIVRLTDTYGDKGYALANINPITNVNHKERKVDITFDVEKGDLVYIERIDIAGNVSTRDKVIRREVEVEEGELYSATGLKRSRSNLKRLGYFEDVAITTQPGSIEDRMVLNVDVKERPTGSFSFGAGYSSVDNFIATVSISQANLFGTGKKLDLWATLSSLRHRYQLGFTEPWLFDKPISGGFDIFRMKREYADFDRDSFGGDLRFGFPVYKREVRGYLTLKTEEVEISNVATNASQLIKDQEGKKRTNSITGTLRRDTRDDVLFPAEGSINVLSVEFAGGPIGGDNDFIKYIVEGVKYFPMPWETTLSIRGTIGYLQGFNGKQAPVYERFYLGGIYSVRVFETRSISPKDPTTGELIGGDKEVVMSAEYLFP
ncbi:MAG: outer membrane protein assembly factor BamA, partial [Deltaproteobacteria bacterium]|nr:outer membrane protein assembly factor BamA [Deltaproteobacteria bacterium]